MNYDAAMVRRFTEAVKQTSPVYPGWRLCYFRVNFQGSIRVMSGHSKWSTIKHKKAAKDAKRGKIFTKLIKEITVAARMGGGDINANPRLRTAVLTARSNSMPGDNIERAIKKGTGELEGVTYEEIQYEGYGPGGTAIIAQVLTDNKNRTVSEIRRLFTKHGGNLGETGSVSWMFEKKGLVTIEKSQIDEERLMGIVLDAGAEDVRDEDDIFEVVTPPEKFHAVKESLDREKIAVASAQVTLIPKNTVDVDAKNVEQILKLTEELEDHDDVQSVSANFNIPNELMEKAS
jgi:YebC/PmpR family DNA-binding regulatory protein